MFPNIGANKDTDGHEQIWRFGATVLWHDAYCNRLSLISPEHHRNAQRINIHWQAAYFF
jgi:hypothetical protein